MAEQIGPKNTVLNIFNRTACLNEDWLSHSYRYFIAGGQTLQAIETCMQEADMVEAEKAKIAAEVGADSINGQYFYFDRNLETVKTHAPGNLVYQSHSGFVADFADPSALYPDITTHQGQHLLRRMTRMEAMPADQAEAERLAICKDYKALDFKNGKFFFKDDGEQVKIFNAKITRIKSNPLFLTSDDSRTYIPDPTKPAGLAIMDRVERWDRARNPLNAFTAWLDKEQVQMAPLNDPRHKGTSHEKKPDLRVEKINGEWIVAVPVITNARFGGADGKGGGYSGYTHEIAVPPDSTPLPVSAYFKRVEDAGFLSFTGPHQLPQPK